MFRQIYKMQDFLNKPARFSQIEFWAATTLFVFAVFFLTTTSESPNKYYFDQARIAFDFYGNYVFPALIQYLFIYLAFLLLNFVALPRIIKKEALGLNITYIFLVFIIGGFLFGITDTYLKNYLLTRYKTLQFGYNFIFQSSFIHAFWLLLMFGFYTAVKHATFYLLSNSKALQLKYRIITLDGLLAIVFWMVSLFLLVLSDPDGEVIIGWGIIGPSGILFYLYSFHKLIPIAITKKKPFRAYVVRSLLLVLVTLIPVSLLGLLLARGDEFGFVLGFFNGFVQLLITMPLSWVLFKRQMRGNEEVFVLKKELGHSNANLDFLRSQINPHFLFNALNTIYGTAIQEKAERTSEGIEKLGDMMRFMLQENLQEKISLNREVEYLNNYISLQKLRTDPNPNVNIQTEIEEQVHTVQIAPMLLIPFVENAFKHGISFREPSHIKITLEIKVNTLYFDVYNSKHQKQENDPEKDKSGIGLRNVKQRLQHVYPAKHELIIRETGKEFFVHLTIQLAL